MFIPFVKYSTREMHCVGLMSSPYFNFFKNISELATSSLLRFLVVWIQRQTIQTYKNEWKHSGGVEYTRGDKPKLLAE